MERFIHFVGRALYFLITAMVIVAPAWYNRYPLLYFDSGAYIEMSAILEPSFHRAFGYPLLMKWTGLMISNWPIILIQGLLLSVLLYRILRCLFPDRRIWWKHTLTVLVLSFASAMSWYAAQLMPDVWTLILILSVSALWLERVDNMRWMLIYGGLILFATLTHLSHFPLLSLLVASLVAIRWLWKSPLIEVNRTKWLSMLVPLVTAILLTCSFNALHGKGFRLSLATHVFLTANLGELGVLKLYVDEQCPNGAVPASLCELRGNLPKGTGGYLWDPNGPVQTHAEGWAGANEEFAQVTTDFLTQPRYLKWFLLASIKATIKQMFQVEIGSGLQYAYGEGTPPYGPMSRHYKQEFNEYITSVQNKGDALPIDFFRWINYLSLALSLGIIAWAIIERKLNETFAALLMLFLLAYFYNAAITGVLANVYERLQVRLLPLIQFLALMILLHVKSAWFGGTKAD